MRQHIGVLVGDSPMLLDIVRRHGAERVVDRSIEVLGYPPAWITDFKEVTELQGEL